MNVAFRELARREVERRLQCRARSVVFLQVGLRLADDRQQLDAALRLRSHLAIDALLREREQLRRFHLLLTGEVRIGRAEDRCDELLDVFGALLLDARDAQLPRGDSEACSQRQHDRSGGAHCDPMLDRELAQAIAGGIRSRDHRIAAQIAIEIVGECGCGRVALARLLLERLEHDRVEIAAQVSRCRALARDGAGCAHFARQHVPVRRERALERVRSLAREQLVRDYAERVHVALGRDRAARDLFRRRVLGREHAYTDLRQRLVRGAAFLDELGDAEVEQVNLSLRVDQDVGRLEIAMDDQSRMRVRDRAGDLRDERDPGAYVELVLAAVDVDRLAFDVLEREIRPAVLGDARVIQASDVRMLERREDLALLSRALGELRQRPPVRQLQRDLSPQDAVGALRQPYGAHAAFADRAEQSVRTDYAADDGLAVRPSPRRRLPCRR